MEYEQEGAVHPEGTVHSIYLLQCLHTHTCVLRREPYVFMYMLNLN